jgi:hypothetical protein
MAITPDNADADCMLGNPAPRGVDTVWHHDLEDIPGGQRCLECGATWMKRKRPKPNSAQTLDV